jgi:hypothetical protein
LDPLKSFVRLHSEIEFPSLDRAESNRFSYLLCYKKALLSRFGMIRAVYNPTVFRMSLSCTLVGRRNLMEMESGQQYADVYISHLEHYALAFHLTQKTSLLELKAFFRPCTHTPLSPSITKNQLALLTTIAREYCVRYGPKHFVCSKEPSLARLVRIVGLSRPTPTPLGSLQHF